jgi:hypothetical protein
MRRHQDGVASTIGSGGARCTTLGGIQVTVCMIGAAHTLLRCNVDSAGAGHGDHTGPMGLGAASIHRRAEGEGSS